MGKGSFEYEMLTLRYLAKKYNTLYDPYYRTVIFNYSSGKTYFHQNISKQWKQSIKSGKPWISTMTIYCPDIEDKSMTWHANALYLDPDSMKIYRFEPHGTKSHYEQHALDNAFKYVAKKYRLGYIRPRAYCDTAGPQQYEKVKGLGFCQSWAFMFLEHVLKNGVPEDFCHDLLESKKNIPVLIENYYKKQVQYVKSARADDPDHTKRIRKFQEYDLDTFNYIYL